MRYIIFAALFALISGCDELTLHEQGVYRGKVDPLLITSANARGSVLAARFELIQAR